MDEKNVSDMDWAWIIGIKKWIFGFKWIMEINLD